MNLEAHASRVSTATEGAPPASAGAAYGWYVVGVLALCYMLSFVDRLILSLLVGHIKRDLVISDTRGPSLSFILWRDFPLAVLSIRVTAAV